MIRVVLKAKQMAICERFASGSGAGKSNCGSRSSIALVAGWLLVAIVSLPGPKARSQILLPEIGDSSQSTLSAANDKELGESFMRELRANVAFVDDPEIESFVSSLGYRLASNSDRANLNFTFFVVDNPGINAFAAPGGFIGINAGLITATESESELAAVLAHEIAHVTQRHIARSLELQDRAMVPVVAGMIAAILIGTQNPQAGVATAAAVQGGAVQSLIDFTRANEQEADRVGIQILSASEFDPRAMPSFFERLQETARYYQMPPEFLSTHPVTSARIAESRDRAERYPYRQYKSSNGYFLARAKLQVMHASTPAEAVNRFREELDSGKYLDLEGATYGYALALLRTGQLDESRKLAKQLIDKNPEQLSLYVLLAEIELAAGNLEEALFVYRDNLELYPQSPILMRGYAGALVRGGKAREALAALDRYARHQPLDAEMHRLAAQAHDQLGNQRSAHAALAEHHYISGRLQLATQQLELAMRTPGAGDFYADSRLEARLEQFKHEHALRTRKK